MTLSYSPETTRGAVPSAIICWYASVAYPRWLLLRSGNGVLLMGLSRMGPQRLTAVSDHETLAENEHYTAKADQRKPSASGRYLLSLSRCRRALPPRS